MLLSIESWPKPGDRAGVRSGSERLKERAAENPDWLTFIDSLCEDRRGRRLLDAIFGNSPFLTECVLQELGFFQRLVEHGVDGPVADELESLARDAKEGTDRRRLMSGLRRAKRRLSLAVALADISGLWPLDKVTGTLTDFAALALQLVSRHLLLDAAERGSIELADGADPEAGSGLIILGLGKFGARELNYSSDIDIIVLYDDQRVRTSRPDDMARTFIRLTRELVRIMEERTADGYVFRTDLRLRPDPGATPVALSVTAAETYYGSFALNWERAAMIKARPVAGDLAAGEEFLRFLRPFVWRRSLDFAALEDLHAMKQQIHRHRGHGTIAVNGHNIKLGRGGIREIELFVQTQQLIYGGRNTRLRTRDTCSGLSALAEAGHIDATAAEDLTLAYHFLRTVEHRLQMVGDHQTHTLPAGDGGIDAIATFLGYEVPDMFRRRLRRTLERVEAYYGDLFEDRPAMPDSGSLAFTGIEDDPDTLDWLGRLGFSEPERVSAMVRGWLHGRYRATRSDRARDLLGQLLPSLLHALAGTQSPDTAVIRFDSFLAKLPAGVQLFSLFYANPDLLDLLTEILGASERLADHLAQHPVVLDAVLAPDFYNRLPAAERLADDLGGLMASAPHYEEALEVLRLWTNDQRFRTGVHVLRRLTGAPECARFLSDVAEIGLTALLDRVCGEFAARHGDFGTSGLAIIAMGKLGGREMTIGSDVDLIAVFDTPEQHAESNGPKPLPPSLYYARLMKRLISGITVPTREGALYSVDMRLRPSGNAGPLVTSLEAFSRYQRENAWTWEHMALSRARAVAGPPELRQRLTALIADTLTQPRDPDRLLADVADMRARIDAEHGTDDVWRVKHARGGIVDIEFIAQYLQLRHGADRPEILDVNTEAVLLRLSDAGLLDAEAAMDLVDALRLWQRVQAYQRLVAWDAADTASASPHLLNGLSRAVLPDRDAPPDFTVAETVMRDHAARVHRHFISLIEAPAAALPGATSSPSN